MFNPVNTDLENMQNQLNELKAHVKKLEDLLNSEMGRNMPADYKQKFKDLLTKARGEAVKAHNKLVDKINDYKFRRSPEFQDFKSGTNLNSVLNNEYQDEDLDDYKKY
jgi:soluble cytochrome b562